MKIIDKVATLVEFSDIKVGECFLYDGCLFIKTHPLEKHGFIENTFCFVDNAICYFKDSWKVIPVEAEVAIISKGG